MKLLKFLRRFWKNSHEILEQGDEIARRVDEAVWVRVRQVASRLGMSERRGYVRARAASLVESEVVAILERHTGWNEGDRHRLSQLALESVVLQVDRRLHTAPPLRRAA